MPYEKMKCGCVKLVTDSGKYVASSCNCEECPHCEELISKEWLETDLEGRDLFEEQCPHCQKEIEIAVEWEPTFYLSVPETNRT